MEYGVGDIVEGQVTGITKFGAFVSIGEGKSGLVHISEVANTFVKEVRDYLTEGQTVTVKIIAIDVNGRINLSIKRALPPEPARPAPQRPVSTPQSTGDTFEDKLKLFLADSNSRMSDLKHQNDRRSGVRRPKPRG